MKAVKLLILLFLIAPLSLLGQSDIADASINLPASLAIPVMDELLVIEDMNPELSPEGRKPLLMIHGWSFEGRPAPPGGGYWDNFRNYILNDPVLRANFKPYYVKYWSNEVPVKEIAAALRDKMEAAGLHEQKIVIMGHSMGGLVSRSYMNEHRFTKGALKNKLCGDQVDLLITLGSPHHGSPMANGPARNAKVSLFLQMTMNTVESFVFKDTKYNQVNRSDLRWDNYDGLLNYQTYSDEKNTWLESLNQNTQYDQRTVCYSGSVTGEFIVPENGNVDEQYKLGAWFMQQGFNFSNDGIVPVQSARFEGHQMKALRHFNGYNHADIIRGKADAAELFVPFKNDLLKAIPLKITWPANPIYVKHSQYRNIEWQSSDVTGSVNLYFSSDNGATYTPIASQVDARSGQYNWKVPDLNATQCKIKIENATFPAENAVSASFTIFHNLISISSPSTNEYFVRYRDNVINWTQEGLGSKVKITYVDPVNGIQRVISPETATKNGLNSYIWTSDKSLPPTSQGQIQIQLLELQQNYGDSETYVFSSQTFHLLADPSISLLSPETSPTDYFGVRGEQLVIGNFYSVKWLAKGEIKFVELFLCDEQKNILTSLGNDNNSPRAEVLKSTRIYVPEYYGDTFYLYARAGFSKDSVTCEAYGENAVRINRKVFIANPADQAKAISIRPCFEVNPVTGANAYIYYIHPVNTGNDTLLWQYESPATTLCVPAKIENELQPGTSYKLTVVARLDTMFSFADQRTFTCEAIPPWTFNILHPQPGDSTELDALEVSWTRAPGAINYRINLEQNGQSLFETTLPQASDTTCTIPLNDVTYYSNMDVKVTAVNQFGETLAQTYFYKKFRTGIETMVWTGEHIGLKNFPNPFSRSTTFQFNIPETMNGARLMLTIFNLNGEKITEVLNENAKAGNRSINWENTGLPLGIYTYRLSLGYRNFSGLLEITKE